MINGTNGGLCDVRALAPAPSALVSFQTSFLQEETCGGSSDRQEELPDRIPRGETQAVDIDWASIGHVPTCEPITVWLRVGFTSVHWCPRDHGPDENITSWS